MKPLYPVLGLISLQQLLTHNAKVYLAARSAQKANDAITELENETGKRAIFLQLDLSDIPAVRKSAQEFLSYVPIRLFTAQDLAYIIRFLGKRNNFMSLSTMRECRTACGADPLRKLIGRGDVDDSGVMVSPKDQLTAQNYDLQFGTNVIGKVPALFGSLVMLTGFPRSLACVGHWLFTKLLLPALFAATDASSTHEKARIVTVSSSANYLTNGINFNAIADGPARQKYGEWELYNKSKFVRTTELPPKWLILNHFYRRVTSLWRASWPGGTETRSCQRVCIRGISVRIFSDTCLGGRTLYLCVPSTLLLMIDG